MDRVLSSWHSLTVECVVDLLRACLPAESDLPSIGGLYVDDSAVMVDGTAVVGPAAIAGLIGPRVCRCSRRIGDCSKTSLHPCLHFHARPPTRVFIKCVCVCVCAVLCWTRVCQVEHCGRSDGGGYSHAGARNRAVNPAGE